MTESATTETTPLVSVVVPFLNAEKFIEEAIESVFVQTYNRWELLLVDDGSTDATTQIARRYAARRPNQVRYLEHPGHVNRGAAASRNLGLRHAQGEYVAFLDADDILLPHKLEQQVTLFKSHPEAGMICGASQYWYGWSGRPEDAARDQIVPVGAPQDALIQPPALLTLLYPLGNGAAPCVASLLVRRSVVEAVNGFEEDFHGIFQLYEDQAFLVKIYLISSVLVSSTCLDFYRQSADSCMSTVMSAGHYHTIRRHFLTWFENYLLEQGERDGEVRQALQRCLAPYRHPTRFFLAELGRSPVGQMRRLASGLRRRALAAFR